MVLDPPGLRAPAGGEFVLEFQATTFNFRCFSLAFSVLFSLLFSSYFSLPYFFRPYLFFLLFSVPTFLVPTFYFFGPQPQQTNRKKRVQICTRKHNFEVQTNVYSFEYKSVLEKNSERDAPSPSPNFLHGVKHLPKKSFHF